MRYILMEGSFSGREDIRRARIVIKEIIWGGFDEARRKMKETGLENFIVYFRSNTAERVGAIPDYPKDKRDIESHSAKDYVYDKMYRKNIWGQKILDDRDSLIDINISKKINIMVDDLYNHIINKENTNEIYSTPYQEYKMWGGTKDKGEFKDYVYGIYLLIPLWKKFINSFYNDVVKDVLTKEIEGLPMNIKVWEYAFSEVVGFRRD